MTTVFNKLHQNTHSPGNMAAVAPRQVPTWDGRELLEITNPDTGYTTRVGYAPSQRRRCRNPIAAHNRAAADKILNKLPRVASRNPNILEDELLDLAELSLCRRYHQGQAEEVVAKWNCTIQREMTRSQVQRPRSSGRNEVSRSGSHSSIAVDHPPVTSSRFRPRITPSSSPERSVVSTSDSSSLETIQQIRQLAYELQTRIGLLEASMRANVPTGPTNQTQSRVDGEAHDEANDEGSEISAPTSPSSSSSSSSENECGICLEPLTLPTRTPCGHTYCQECIETWLANPTRQSCPHDRRTLHLEDLVPVAAPIDCGICLRQVVRPKRTPCGHTFCGGCIERWLRTGVRPCCPFDRRPVRVGDLTDVAE